MPSSKVGCFGFALLSLVACSGGDEAPVASGSSGASSSSSSSSGDPIPDPNAPYAGGDVTVSLVGADATAPLTGIAKIHVAASNPAALSKIDVLVDGGTIATLYDKLDDLQWNSASVANGAHTISAKPYDKAGKAGTANEIALTTRNFTLAGTWTWSNITDAHTGFATTSCSSKTITVGFDYATSTVTFPSFSVTCTAQNGAPYSASVTGFTKVLTSLDEPLTDTQGYKTITMTSTSLRRVETPFAGSSYTLNGKLTRQ